MRAALLGLMGACGVVSACMADVRWLAARAERELLAAQVYFRPASLVTPTPFALPAPLLQPGMEARVQMLEGEWLNLRAAPGLHSEVIALLPDNTRLLLLEGPLEREGHRWWRVRVSGREGWCVEQAGDVLAITLPPTATPAF